jgi:hypothetical protein
LPGFIRFASTPEAVDIVVAVQQLHQCVGAAIEVGSSVTKDRILRGPDDDSTVSDSSRGVDNQHIETVADFC